MVLHAFALWAVGEVAVLAVGTSGGRVYTILSGGFALIAMVVPRQVEASTELASSLILASLPMVSKVLTCPALV